MPRISCKPRAEARTARLACGAALAIVAGCLLDGWSGFAPARARLQVREFRLGEHDVTKLHYLLLGHGLLPVRRPAALASTSALPAAALSANVPTLSIACPDDDLHSPDRGILANPKEGGRKWERRATFSYFENGALRYEAHAGLRVHGGSSRGESIPSLKLIFRRTYEGSPRAKPGIFWGGESPAVQRLALINTSLGQRFLNALAHEIARDAGCTTSRFQPVRVFLNGELLPCGYFLFEHQSREFLKSLYGHDDFEWVRLKARKGEPRTGEFDDFWNWARSRRSTITVQSVAERYDLDDLCAWNFAITFCGTRDEEQGAYYRDKRDPSARWRSLTWDMDGSFNRGLPFDEQHFDFESKKGLRRRLFRRLCSDDPAFRAHYREFAARMLREKVTPERIRALVAKCRALLEGEVFAPNRAGLLPMLESAERFLLERHPRYLDELDRFLTSAEG